MCALRVDVKASYIRTSEASTSHASFSTLCTVGANAVSLKCTAVSLPFLNSDPTNDELTQNSYANSLHIRSDERNVSLGLAPKHNDNVSDPRSKYGSAVAAAINVNATASTQRMCTTVFEFYF